MAETWRALNTSIREGATSITDFARAAGVMGYTMAERRPYA